MCIPGQDGEKLAPEVDSLLNKEQDQVICKKYYSAFTDTILANILREVKEIHICGLMTNVCVQATATDAFFYGYKVFIWTDCLGYRSRKRHQEALDKMQRWYATMTTASKCLEQSQTATPLCKPVLYFVNGSIPSWRVMMVLHEKGIDFEAKRLKVMSTPKETKSIEFLTINPRGLTPTLVDSDGAIITESLAILHYLEQYYPHTLSLLPITKADHIKVLQRVQESQNLVDIYEPLEEIVFKTPEHEQSAHKSSIVKTLTSIDHELIFWETYATKSMFIACDQFTLADCAFYPVVTYLIHRGLSIDKFSALKDYVERIRAKSSAIKAHPRGWGPKGGKVNVFETVRTIVEGCNEKTVDLVEKVIS
ncbi:unnamed protein product [Didymodactylos carnosus]|uniref:Glutathione S-transferase n=1 Tax=Didymodactylos carnosus TaxID=1234261 RepID=A0A814XMB8_9BILA|nr:unnamed protein product [Didymodactylos carnosus]CAF1217846.1 unnamed protein product [Didymodactylos carnosus]CAF3669689.1 unnamed protein product [Didymodactylos carnosus]CAF3981472.1 unnamed protein product [Didymodactylos carnosus]